MNDELESTSRQAFVCPRCGSPTDGSSAYCGTCGLHLLDEDELPTRERWEQQQPTRETSTSSEGPASRRVPGNQLTWSRGTAIAALAVVAAIGVIGFIIGSAGDDNGGGGGGSRATGDPFADARDQLFAEKDEQAESGEFVPPNRENLLTLLEEEGLGSPVPNPDSAVVVPYDDQLPSVPETDLTGRPTGDDPSQWFQVSFCDEGGGVSTWDVNPYTVNAFQSSLSLNVDGPVC